MAVTKKVPISSLKPAKFNPTARGLQNPLGPSLKRYGMLYPILTTKDRQVIDGHRRLAAAKLLGWKEVEIREVGGKQPELYAEVNSKVAHISGNDNLNIYLAEPGAVTPRTFRRLKEIEDVAGIALLRRMAAEKQSATTWSTAKRVAKQADQDTKDVKVQLLKWMIHFKCAHATRRAMTAGMAPGQIVVAAQKMKQLKLTYTT